MTDRGRMEKVTTAKRLQYTFDNTIAKGPLVLIAWLGLLVFGTVIAIAILTWFLTDAPPAALGEQVWTYIVTTIVGWDPTEDYPWSIRFSMFLVILINLFGASIFVGFIVTGLEERLARLRRGRSVALEANHTVILGWSSQVFPILYELAIANEDESQAAVVILGDEDKIEMEEAIRSQIPHLGRTRIVVRSGVPSDIIDLRLASLNTAKSIIILAPEEGNNPDASVIKSLLAITNHPDRRREPYHIVAAIENTKNWEIAKLVGGNEVELIASGELVARITAQICRQSGLSRVYTALFSFLGNEIYVHEQPEVVGKTFGDLMFLYEDSTVIGISPGREHPTLNPPMETPIKAGDRLIVISDDGKIRLSKKSYEIQKAALRTVARTPEQPEQFLILGWNSSAFSLVSQLDDYVPPDSQVTIVANAEQAEDQVQQLTGLTNLTVSFKAGDITDRRLLDELDFTAAKNVIVLSYWDWLDNEDADATSLTTLLHLRDIAKQKSWNFTITSEILETRNQRLARVAQVEDFIVSDRLISSLLAQISEDKLLGAVFNNLLDPEGSEIFLKSANDYVATGEAVNFYTVVEAARRRQEVALGYRLQVHANREDKRFGVIINPRKSKRIVFQPEDRIIVLAED